VREQVCIMDSGSLRRRIKKGRWNRVYTVKKVNLEIRNKRKCLCAINAYVVYVHILCICVNSFIQE
jgi:hypothetical protein